MKWIIYALTLLGSAGLTSQTSYEWDIFKMGYGFTKGQSGGYIGTEIRQYIGDNLSVGLDLGYQQLEDNEALSASNSSSVVISTLSMDIYSSKTESTRWFAGLGINGSRYHKRVISFSFPPIEDIVINEFSAGLTTSVGLASRKFRMQLDYNYTGLKNANNLFQLTGAFTVGWGDN